MAGKASRADRRELALSRGQIVDAAVELLDGAGEGGLTFRALSARLKTGPGAIYWHVANKDELLAAATDAVLGAALSGATAQKAPQEAIRVLALGVFDAIDRHAWIGGQLSRPASQSTLLPIIERIGRQVQALGVPQKDQFDVVSAIVSYVLGVGGQNAAHAAQARARKPDLGSRDEFLGGEAARWADLDPQEYPFARSVAAQLADHDDRAQFLAGLDLILAGARALT